MTTPAAFLAELRGRGPSEEAVISTYLTGACLHIYAMLKHQWPEAVGFLHNEEHVVTQIDGVYYDIEGPFKATAHLIALNELSTEQLRQLLSLDT